MMSALPRRTDIGNTNAMSERAESGLLALLSATDLIHRNGFKYPRSRKTHRQLSVARSKQPDPFFQTFQAMTTFIAKTKV
jgi:hypothetical protein